MKRYYNFVNEAKVTDMKVGDYVLFTKNLVKYKVKGTYAKIVEIRPDMDNPDKILYCMEIQHEGNPIVIKMSKVDNLQVVDGKLHEKIVAGKIAKPVVISQKMNVLLAKISFTIPNEYQDISYIDVDPEKDDTISYISVIKTKGLSDPDRFSSKLRQTMGIGRFLKKMDPKISPTQLEKKVNEYKAFWSKIKNYKDSVMVVVGEDIRHWYHQQTYTKTSRSSGPLFGSCMRYSDSQHRFNIYCENVDKIAMAILLDEDGNLAARAIIFKLNEPAGRIYMERIYYAEEKHRVILHNHAKEKGWLCYEDGGYDTTMVVRLNRNYGSPRSNPYMDTMRYLFKDDNGYFLTNKSKNGTYVYEYCDHD